MPVVRMVLERIAYAFVLVTAVLVLNFILVRLAPGDPAEVIAGESGGITQEILDAIRRDYGLDLPIHEQLWIYLGNALQGDWDIPSTSTRRSSSSSSRAWGRRSCSSSRPR